MRGTRVKELRRRFRDLYGRPPRGSVIVRVDPRGRRGWKEEMKVAPSRRSDVFEGDAVNAPGKLRRVRVVTEMFLRRIFGFHVRQPSEWRRWKKQYQRNAR